MSKIIPVKVIFCISLISVGYLLGLYSNRYSFANNRIEYKVVNLPGDPNKIETLLNTLGSDGWEFISELNHCVVLKR